MLSEELKPTGPDATSNDEQDKQETDRDEGGHGALEEESSLLSDNPTAACCNFCSFAVTGGTPTFQAIFVCNSCFNENDGDREVPLCICQACADHCHDPDSHDVEYIGMGPSYCDCDHVGNCSIFQKSQVEAERMAIVQGSSSAQSQATTTIDQPEAKDDSNDPTTLHESPDNDNNTDDSTARVMQDVYEIPSLQTETIAITLVQHAQELIIHSKETFWMDDDLVNRLNDTTTSTNGHQTLCALEQLAWDIYQQHRQRYGSLLEGRKGGAEWWVQVKEITPNTDKNTAAIDLHYDKDEALAEAFGIGAFPCLSTVTYLTAAPNVASPTIVFNHVYAQGEEELITEMLVSRPRIGKHLVFDGNQLHGAPSHPLLLQPATTKQIVQEGVSPSNDGTDARDDNDLKHVRVTFLVNVWKDHKPAGVQCLDDSIRQALLSLPSPELEFPLALSTQTIPEFLLNKEEDLPENLRGRIELPFVSKGVTWEDQLNLGGSDDDEDDSGGLVVTTFPPPPTEDTLLVKFGAELQAYLDYQQQQEDDTPKEQDDIEHESGYV